MGAAGPPAPLLPSCCSRNLQGKVELKTRRLSKKGLHLHKINPCQGVACCIVPQHAVGGCCAGGGAETSVLQRGLGHAGQVSTGLAV